MIDALASMQVHGNSGEIGHLVLMLAILAALQMTVRQ